MAAVIILAGIGVGVYFCFFRDGQGSDVTTTTLTYSPTTATSGDGANGGTTITEGTTTSTGGPVTSGSATSQTIPSLTPSTGPPTTSRPPTTENALEAYLLAAENLTVALDRADRRIPDLATEINNTAPAVPARVRSDLAAMLSGLNALNVELASLEVPAGFMDSYHWLAEATVHMSNRIEATIQGVEAIWAAGRVNAAAQGFFDTGRKARDAYRAAMKKYYEVLPVD